MKIIKNTLQFLALLLALPLYVFAFAIDRIMEGLGKFDMWLGKDIEL